MSLNANLPGARQPLVDAGGVPSRPFYVFFQSVATTLQSLSDQIGDVTTTPSESPISENANVIGAYSIYTQGVLKAGIVRVLLQGDVQTPGNTQYYGSGPTGGRGWFNVSDALAASSNVTLTVGANGVTTFDLADLADSGTGSALVKITRDSKGRIAGTSAATTSDLAEGTNLYYTDARADARVDAGITALKAEADPFPQYTTDAEAAAAAPVQSVNGYTGAFTLTAADVGAATTAQGAKADSAVQSIVAGTGVSVDATDPHNPVVSATGSGSGDVVGPASATDGDVALFDGTTGKLLKDGGSLGAAVRAAVLTGLSTSTSAVIAATDTVLGAQGKLQAQITDNLLTAGYIDGLQMKWVSGTALTVTSGAAYIEGSGKVLRATANIAKTGLSLTASTWYHVYLYSNAGTPDVEISTTAPDAPYNGTARAKTGDSSRRYVGSIKTSAAGAIYNFVHTLETGLIFYRNQQDAAPFRLLQNGQATTETAVSAAAVAPVTASMMQARLFTSPSTSSAAYFGTSDDSAGGPPTSGIVGVGPNSNAYTLFPLNSAQQLTYWNQSAPGINQGAFVDVYGYLFDR